MLYLYGGPDSAFRKSEEQDRYYRGRAERGKYWVGWKAALWREVGVETRPEVLTQAELPTRWKHHHHSLLHPQQ